MHGSPMEILWGNLPGILSRRILMLYRYRRIGLARGIAHRDRNELVAVRHIGHADVELVESGCIKRQSRVLDILRRENHAADGDRDRVRQSWQGRNFGEHSRLVTRIRVSETRTVDL